MSDTYPWAWYTDEEVLRTERERIFRSAWHYVGHAGRVAEPSSYLASTSGGLPAVVTRDRDGELRAFLNVCRHRGAEVARRGPSRLAPVPVPRLDVRARRGLRSAPRGDREPGFDPAGLSLVPLRLESWGPFLFVNADSGRAPARRALGGLALPFDPATSSSANG